MVIKVIMVIKVSIYTKLSWLVSTRLSWLSWLSRLVSTLSYHGYHGWYPQGYHGYQGLLCIHTLYTHIATSTSALNACKAKLFYFMPQCACI